MIRAVIFDLDETLYDEMRFVKGGFKAVSLYVSKCKRISQEKINALLLQTLKEQGRGHTFNAVLKDLKLDSENLVPKLIDIYRAHQPDISLYPGAKRVIFHLKKEGYKLGLITDGDVKVQQRKAKALRIEDIFDCMIFSDEYGVDKRKPSPFPYEISLEKLAVRPEESLYVGDNPRKDFVTAKKIGIHTVRIMRGQHKNVLLDENHEAHFKIKVLGELFNILKAVDKEGENHSRN
jgi:putative hydrolase of the HAD superfamily